MKVKAIKMGFYGEGRKAKRIKIGEIFPLLKASDFSARWMEWAEKPASTEPETVGTKAESEPKVVVPRPRGNPAWLKKKK